jgi:hydrogenase expression/formation protein HypD
MLVNQIIIRKPAVEIQYTRAVKPEGNPSAMKVLHTVFEPCDAEWRGIGVIPGSGLKIRDIYSTYDAEKVIPVTMEPLQEQKGCICGEILQGIKLPSECSLFKNLCTPERPIGACMVSSEGTCAAYYKYGV